VASTLERPRRYRRLPRRQLGAVLEAFPEHRQTILGQFDNCRLSALFELEGYPHTNAEQARGILFHRFAARVLTTLRQTGEVEIPVGEALAILYEVMAQRDVPDEEVVLPPARERRLLRILAIKFAAENRFSTDRIMMVEERLRTTLTYPHPDGGLVERVLTGAPDAVIAAEGGIVIPDWKTTRRAPARGDEGDHHDDPDHVSYQGYFQQRVYGVLGLHRFPAAEFVRLREFYVFEGVARYATILRSDLEHVEQELATLMELLDRAIAGGSRSRLWAPSPGKHCAYCPKPVRCPIEADVRLHEGGITGPAQARRAAAEYVLARRVGEDLHEALANWCDHHGPVDVKSAKGRAQVRWKANSTGRGRRFGVHVPEASDRGPDDPQLERVFLEVAERAREAGVAA
jgi:hypothetical protein